MPARVDVPAEIWELEGRGWTLGLRFCLCRSDPGKEEVETQAVEAMTKVAGPRLRASRELDAEGRKKDL